MGGPAVDVSLRAPDAPLHKVFSLIRLLGDLSHLETLTMRSLTLTGTAILTAALLTGCGAEAGPTAENIPGLTADATDHNVADHFKIVVPGIFDVENPCNGELIILSGEEIDQLTLVGPREVLDAGGFLHME